MEPAQNGWRRSATLAAVLAAMLEKLAIPPATLPLLPTATCSSEMRGTVVEVVLEHLPRTWGLHATQMPSEAAERSWRRGNRRSRRRLGTITGTVPSPLANIKERCIFHGGTPLIVSPLGIGLKRSEDRSQCGSTVGLMHAMHKTHPVPGRSRRGVAQLRIFLRREALDPAFGIAICNAGQVPIGIECAPESSGHGGENTAE